MPTTDHTVDDTPATAPPDPPAPRSRVRRWLTPALIVLLAAAAGFCGFRWWQAEQTEGLRADALDRAREYAIALGTYDYQHFDDALAAVTDVSTGEFAEKYRSVAGDLRGLVENGHGVSVATVSHAAVETLDADRATVLVFLDQDVKNVAVPDGRVDATRFLITLARVDDRWLLQGADAK
ncbi:MULTISPECIES: hypothetical protein [Rhodococcus]|uniref:hypothetical protein n=1 Tax=Rhodococcus TaxID=1827 RepID=UPI000622C4A4|nr:MULTISPECIES: hypothetical protein [Rhodococcus]AKE88292.1 hypothetical protein AAT18_02585 [Rhodococcus aetherivorans]ANZ27081.1 hypothetical protein A4U64_22115 [Rhodococcus sp. WB1]MBC2592165.1 hypothetical protein [Rhodococcus aetherivorans]MDV6296026.1 hypothetical protein [Rhodococcus aetherivorans]WFS12249.1 hypothetical protein P9K37_21060 [Rhodococcus aetherivorans]